MKFVHVFSRKIRCTITAPDEAPPRGTVNQLDYEWTEPLKKKHTGEYIRWVIEVNRICADRWKQSILYCIQTTPATVEVWAFEPGEAPVRVSEREMEVGS
jgi:hypothetical protein